MLTYFFCKIFKIVRIKSYIVFEDGTFKQFNLKFIPDIITYKETGKMYVVDRVLTEVINSTLTYNWIKVEEYLTND